MVHTPVLKKEVLEYLDPKPNENFIDCTFGQGGHGLAILEKNKPSGKVLGIDWDLQGYEIKDKRLILIKDSYVNLKKIVKEKKFGQISGILLDLGMSSWHIDQSKRGFSFMRDEVLDMRYNTLSNRLTAEEIINNWKGPNIEEILQEYGEERFAKRISRKIVEEREIRPIKTTFHLVEVIKKAIPLKCRRDRIHFATRTFQALRIAVNDELNNLKNVLTQGIEILAPGGRMLIISFHSLEDRIVKRFFKDFPTDKLTILTKKPITPSQEEIKVNRRSRSAKLRAAKKPLL